MPIMNNPILPGSSVCRIDYIAKDCQHTMSTQRRAKVPWSDQGDWDQMKLSLEVTIASQGERLHGVRVLADQITEKLCSTDSYLETLCKNSCVTCADICCGRATLWYDFRDILFLLLSTSGFPGRQLFKKTDLTCSCLTSAGCRLKRCERPFICTWYICPKQKDLLESAGLRENGSSVFSLLQEIKTDRKTLEQKFLGVVCGEAGC